MTPNCICFPKLCIQSSALWFSKNFARPIFQLIFKKSSYNDYSKKNGFTPNLEMLMHQKCRSCQTYLTLTPPSFLIASLLLLSTQVILATSCNSGMNECHMEFCLLNQSFSFKKMYQSICLFINLTTDSQSEGFICKKMTQIKY